MKRGLVVTGVAVLALFGAAAPAAAHNTLIGSNPEDGSRIATAPDTVTLEFDQPVQDADVNEIAVTGPGGGAWVDGDVRVDSNVVTAPLRPLGPAGEYVIGFRVLSADGHPVSEELRFTLTQTGTTTGAPPTWGTASEGTGKSSAPETPAAQPAADESEDSGIPVWVWLIAAVVLLGAGITVALRMGRGDRSS